MTKRLIFGAPEPNIHYTERRASYVVITRDGKVAVVKSGESYFLPGGGSLPGEAPEETVLREVREELARCVRLVRKLGEATQYFYSPDDDRHYKMHAVFFAGEFTNDICDGTGEHQLSWLPITEPAQAYFHDCHAWAVHQT